MPDSDLPEGYLDKFRDFLKDHPFDEATRAEVDQILQDPDKLRALAEYARGNDFDPAAPGQTLPGPVHQPETVDSSGQHVSSLSFAENQRANVGGAEPDQGDYDNASSGQADVSPGTSLPRARVGGSEVTLWMMATFDDILRAVYRVDEAEGPKAAPSQPSQEPPDAAEPPHQPPTVDSTGQHVSSLGFAGDQRAVVGGAEPNQADLGTQTQPSGRSGAAAGSLSPQVQQTGVVQDTGAVSETSDSLPTLTPGQRTRLDGQLDGLKDAGKLPDWTGTHAPSLLRDQMQQNFQGTHDIAGAAEALCNEGFIIYDQTTPQGLSTLVTESGLSGGLDELNYAQTYLGSSFYGASSRSDLLYTNRMNCFEFVHLAGWVANDANGLPRFNNLTDQTIDPATRQVWDGSADIPRGKVIIGYVEGSVDSWWVEGEGKRGEYHFGISLGNGMVVSNHDSGPQIETLQSVFGTGWLGYDRVEFGDYAGYTQPPPSDEMETAVAGPSKVLTSKQLGKRVAASYGGGVTLAGILIAILVLLFFGGGDGNSGVTAAGDTSGDRQAQPGFGTEPTITPAPTATPTPGPTDTEETGTAAGQQQSTGQQPASAPPAQTSGSSTQRLTPSGKATGTFENIIKTVSGNCGPNAVVGGRLGGTGEFEIVDSGGVLRLRSADGLDGTFNPITREFDIRTADGVRSSVGTISEDGLRFVGQSTLRQANSTCVVVFDFTASFNRPLFTLVDQPAAQPAAQAPTGPTPTPTPSSAPDVKALIKTAIEGEFTQAIRTGNGQYQLSHTSPAAIAFYGQQKCQAWFANIGADPTASYTVLGITGPETWVWVYKNQTIGTIQNVYTLTVQVTRNGVSSTAQPHAGWENGQLVVFLPCEGA